MFRIHDFAKYYETNNLETSSYYESYAQKYVEYPQVTQWNWAAAFFNVIWLLYRKSYRAFFISILVIAAARALFNPVFMILSIPIIFLIFGMYGNNLYFWDMKMRIANHSQVTGTNHFLFVLLFLPCVLLSLFFIGLNMFLALIFFIPLVVMLAIVSSSLVWLVFWWLPVIVGLILLAQWMS